MAMPSERPFNPSPAGSFIVANATSASSPALLSEDAEQVVLTNTSAIAYAYWRCTNLTTSSDAGAAAAVPTTVQNPAVGGMPIPPLAQIRITVGYGPKKFSVIASAADGNLIITPGKGN